MAERVTGVAAWADTLQPWSSGFFSVMRAIGARCPDAPAPGMARLPGEETYRIGQVPSMQFAPREVAALDVQAGRLEMQLYGLGLWGPQGPMPLQWTERVMTQGRQASHPMASLADMFHHRALSQFYRAWSCSQSAASLDREHDSFAFYVASLAGINADVAQKTVPGLHPHIAWTAHLVREVRNPDGLCQSLAWYFSMPVALEEYVLHWLSLDQADRSCLGGDHPALRLGDGAVLGERVPDRQHCFRMVIGPLRLEQYLRLLPGGEDLPALTAMVRTFIGFEYDWEVALLLHADEAVPAVMSSAHQLGRSTWLGEQQGRDVVQGMVFAPEWVAAQMKGNT